MEEHIKSTHKAEVVPIVLEKHPNADKLSIVNVFDGYPCIVNTEDWKDKKLGVYLPPDSVVNTDRPEFAFLKSSKGRQFERITVRKFRGSISFGLLVPAPEGCQEGDDLASQLEIGHYEPHTRMPGNSLGKSLSSTPPDGYHPDYDVDNLRRYRHVFEPGELITISEKIHGTNARFVYTADGMFCGSHKRWIKEEESSVWWRILRQYPELEKFCRDNPQVTVYGEIYGAIQNLRYGTKDGEIKLAVFDILTNMQWLNVEEARTLGKDLPWVPLITLATSFDWENLIQEAERDSLIHEANHLREGIVVKPIEERIHHTIGRVNLKLVSSRYLEMK